MAILIGLSGAFCNKSVLLAVTSTCELGFPYLHYSAEATQERNGEVMTILPLKRLLPTSACSNPDAEGKGKNHDPIYFKSCLLYQNNWDA